MKLITITDFLAAKGKLRMGRRVYDPKHDDLICYFIRHTKANPKLFVAIRETSVFYIDETYRVQIK